MALPSPTAAFPDMTGTISASQARARDLMNAAWAGMASIGQRPVQFGTPESVTALETSMADYGGPVAREPWRSRNPRGDMPGIASYGTAPDPDVRELLAQTIQGEAGGEGFDGMLAVGSVIGNRARSGRYGGTSINDVIMAPGQFSMWNGVTGYAGGEGAIDPSQIRTSREAYEVADLILGGGYTDPTGGATHYYNPAIANPAWGQSRAGGEWQTIGNHIFGWADGRPDAHLKTRG